MTFGDRLKYFRKQKQLSQGDLSKIVGISQTVISSYEQNKSKPKFEHIVPIAKALDITTDSLFGVPSLSDDEWLMHFLYTRRNSLRNSKNVYDRNIAFQFDFVINEIELEQKRMKNVK